MRFDFQLLTEEQKQEYRDFEDLQAQPGWTRLCKELEQDIEASVARGADSADLKELGYWKGCRTTLRTIINAASARIDMLEGQAVAYSNDDYDDGEEPTGDRAPIVGLMP